MQPRDSISEHGALHGEQHVVKCRRDRGRHRGCQFVSMAVAALQHQAELAAYMGGRFSVTKVVETFPVRNVVEVFPSGDMEGEDCSYAAQVPRM